MSTERPSANEHSFVSVQHRAPYMKTYARFILAGDKFTIKALLCISQYFCLVDSEVQFNNTHTMHCSVSTATMATQRATMLRYTYVAYCVCPN
jgi:hypothetical protein